MEEWRAIPNFENYFVSSFGRVRSEWKRASRILKLYENTTTGYLQVGLYRDGKNNSRTIHRLVMISFIGERPEGMEILHTDGNNKNNNLINLRYGTHSENIQDAIKHGTHYSDGRDKTHCKRGHEFNEENTLYYKKQRLCSICHKQRSRASYLRKINAKDLDN